MLVMLVGLGACTAKTSETTAGATPPSSSPASNGVPSGAGTAPVPSLTPGSGSLSTPGGTSAPETVTDPTTERTAQPPEGASAQQRKNWAPLVVSINRTCLRRGDELVADAASEPYADFAFTTGYSREPNEPKIVPDYAYLDGAANPSGEVTWRVVIRPTVPYGPAVFKVVVKTPEGRGAFESFDLVIAKECP